MMEPGPPVVAQVDVLLIVPKVTLKISSSALDVADEAAYVVGAPRAEGAGATEPAT